MYANMYNHNNWDREMTDEPRDRRWVHFRASLTMLIKKS